jgi:hypothetical protein
VRSALDPLKRLCCDRNGRWFLVPDRLRFSWLASGFVFMNTGNRKQSQLYPGVLANTSLIQSIGNAKSASRQEIKH